MFSHGYSTVLLQYVPQLFMHYLPTIICPTNECYACDVTFVYPYYLLLLLYSLLCFVLLLISLNITNLYLNPFLCVVFNLLVTGVHFSSIEAYATVFNI